MNSNTHILEVGDYVEEHSKVEAADHFGLAASTIKRYYTSYQQIKGTIIAQNPKSIVIKKLFERYTPEELRQIAEGKAIEPASSFDIPELDFNGEVVKVGFITDTHIGSTSFGDYLWNSFVGECKAQHVQCILHAGDLIEGMSNRPDQIYQLEDIGYSAQEDHAERLIESTPFDIYAIDGNHDRWGIKSGGVFALEDIAKQCKNLHFVGHDCGDVEINGTTWRLWHGEDSSSYAVSYRVQKLIEAFSESDIPDALLCGHTHKHCYIYERGVHAVSGGSLSKQTAWMRSKRISAKVGFHIITAIIRDGKIISFCPTFYSMED